MLLNEYNNKETNEKMAWGDRLGWGALWCLYRTKKYTSGWFKQYYWKIEELKVGWYSVDGVHAEIVKESN